MSGRELGRISGPLLANNLKRNGQNLAFDNTVLYLNVNSNYIGVNTNAPAYALDVNGTTRTTYIDVATQANLANLEFYTNNIQNVVGNITISPHSSGTTVVPQLQATNLLFSGNILSSTNTNGNINIGLTGASTAQIKLNNSVLVSGNLHATGDITWDGNITLGNNVGVDTVTFDAEINSSIIPSANNTDNLGSPSYVWATTYANTVNATTTSATSLSTTSLTGAGTNNLNNNVTIGTTNANTLTINAEINTSLIPNVTNTDTLGSSTNLWNNIYGVTFLDGNITLTSNTIQTTTTNSSLQLKANGTGQVVMSAVNVTNNTTVGGTLGVTGTSTLTNTSTGAITEVGNISQTGNFTTTGTISSGSITSSQALTLPSLIISGTTGGTPALITTGLQINLATAPSTATVGTTWSDTSGNSNNGTLAGSNTYLSYTSNDGGGISISGNESGTYISTAYNIASNTFTISMVASLNPTTFWSTMWGNDSWSAGKGYLAYFLSTTSLNVGSASGTANFTVSNITSINVWDFVISGTSVTVYQNGTSLGTKTFTGPSGGYATTGLYFASRHANGGSGPTDNCVGTYYAMRVYNVALNSTQITNNYNAVGATYGLSVSGSGTTNASAITGINSNTNLTLTPKSGQLVEITSSALVDGNTTVGGTLTVGGTSTLTNTSTGAITEVGNINQTGNFTTTGTISSGSITASNPLILPDLTFGSGIVNGGSTVYSTILGTTSNTNLVLTPYTGKLVEFGGSVLVDGNSTVGGTLTVGGTTTLTNTTTGAITETGNINQTGNFTTTGTISSGSITASNPLTLSGMTLNGSVVTGTLSNSNLILTPKSGQQVEITSGAKVDTNLSVGGTLTISGTSTLTNTTVGAVGTPSNITLVGAYNQTGNFTTTGTISSDAITATNPLVLPDLTINNTTITGTTVNTNLVLTPHTGKIVEITSGAKVDQNLSVGGTLTVGGTSTLTNTTTGAITEVGNITQTGNFTTTGTISSGSITSSGTVYLPNMTLSNSTITGIGSSANLIFTPYTGKVVEFVSATTLDQNATIGGTLTVGSTTSLGNTNANAINLTGAYNLTGNATLGAVSSGAITSTGKLTLPDLILSGTPSGVSSTITGIVSNTNLTLTPYSGKIVEITSGAKVDQNLSVGGTLTVGGTSTLTNTSANAITLTGAYNLTGNATLGAVSSGSITATNPFISSTVEINGSTITGLASGSNLKFTANAGQVVEVTSDTAFDHNVSVTGTLGVTGTTTLASTTINGTVTQTGDFNQTGNFTTSGNVSTNSITFDGLMDYFDPDDFVIGGNTITVSPTNGSMTFTANGTGSVWLGNDLKINGNTIINDWINVSVPLLSESGIQFIDEIGDEYYSELGVPTKIQDGIFLKPTGSGQVIISSTRSLILPLSDDSKYTLTTNGEIRFNDVNLNVEGYSNSGYVNFINLYSRDQQTYITPEATPGAADNTLRFAVGGTVTTTITSSSLANNNLIVNNAVNITGTTIQSVNNSNNITLYSSGNKTVKFNGFNYIVDNTINTPSSGALTISPTGTGYVQIAGTSGLGIPVGNNANYPSAPVIGTLRYNTTRSYPEVYNGSTWIPAYGTSSQPSATDVQDLVLVYELILGF